MTPNEEKLYFTIFHFIREFGYPPTIRELADICHYDRRYIRNLLQNLKSKNIITYQERKVRTIVIQSALETT